MPGEELLDLQAGGLRLIQKTDGYRFTSDSVLLANFVKNVKGKRVAELCSGSGVISVLVGYKCRPGFVAAVEIQPEVAEMSRRSIGLNGQSGVITVFTADAKDCAGVIGSGFDAVIANPPYRKVGSGQTQTDPAKALSRHEIEINLEQLAASAAKLLRGKGSFYLVHQSERAAEVFYLMHAAGVEPKEVCFVRPRASATPNLLLVRGVKGGKAGLKFLPDIVVFDKNGGYTQTIKLLYGESYE